MEKMLQEILTKIDFIMSNTYVNEENTIMDLYDLKIPPTVEQIVDVSNLEEQFIKQLIEVAYKTGKFIIENNREGIIIEHLDKAYRVPYERFVNGK